ncbi:MAG: SDR family NAD(P)-dependent oxidoreductase [Deltaproteobacteria bacterium]|nr:SDR family NAD(P)-dependent oxidoreductase [Deltaproteobacteria bacterium]MBW2070252.1 SDR family NAD(P)-dependent oxidoreductase [Deltaproteobacteria bacterium]
MTRIVALTGGTGFIGRAIARRLQAEGYRVKALLRSSFSASPLAGYSIEFVPGDLSDTDSLCRLVEGADFVVHCAGVIRGAWKTDFERVNVEGVARLVQAVTRQHPVPRFLLISSLAAREPQLSMYAASKRQGEIMVEQLAGEMAWTAFRPPAVYGPEDRELLPLFRLMARGIAPVLGPPEARFSLLFVEDLAEAVLHWLRSSKSVAAAIELHDGKTSGYTWQEVVDTVGRLCHRRIRCFSVPEPLLRTAALVNLSMARLLGYAPMLTPDKVRELCHLNWVCKDDACSRMYGWQPQVTLEEGLRRTFEHGNRWMCSS